MKTKNETERTYLSFVKIKKVATHCDHVLHFCAQREELCGHVYQSLSHSSPQSLSLFCFPLSLTLLGRYNDKVKVFI